MCNSVTIEINTLNEYISLIKEKKLSEYYFRGENKKYPTISSSLLRRDTSSLLKDEKFSFYEDIVNHYYSEIASNIGEIERNNFLAFSQHHGLTTNLIDFTTSPLIALYFACANKNDVLDKNTGFVYLINKEKTIDISKMINEVFISPANSYSLIQTIIKNNNSFKAFVSYLNHFFWENSILPYNQNLTELSLRLSTMINDESLPSFLKEYIKITDRISDISEISDIFDYLPELISEYVSNFDMKIDATTLQVWRYIIMLYEYFNNVSYLAFSKPTEGIIEFPQMPYFIYKTPYKFDRIRNQDGIFIYQLYHTFATRYEDVPEEILRQEIIPDVTIVINNQKQILEELDFIGINLKSIYGDFDNIASYVNNKFF
ncbi:FRG domain-containing protein [Viridibacillus arvi]|uniref:FRG domain-containing protein n=1 Tax=Viridibacillus arvi TaxID=263475 RepID=UPI0006A971AC|nr:FRG domain-containing protein [Viridibacillus arvi]